MATNNRMEKIIGTVAGIGIAIALTLLIMSAVGSGTRTTVTTSNAVLTGFTNNTETTFTGYTFLQEEPSSCVLATPGNNLTFTTVSFFAGDENTDASGVYLTNDTVQATWDMNCSITHKTSTTASTALETVTGYLGSATTWLNILIIVAFASMVMMVYKSKKGNSGL